MYTFEVDICIGSILNKKKIQILLSYHCIIWNNPWKFQHCDTFALSGMPFCSCHSLLLLLLIQKERESFLSHHIPEGERLLIFDLCPDSPSSTQQVGHAHSALSRCLEMLECVIAREVEELGEDFEGEYETTRNTVKDRIRHLLHSTGALLENGEDVCAPLPEFQCIQVGKERRRDISLHAS